MKIETKSITHKIETESIRDRAYHMSFIFVDFRFFVNSDVICTSCALYMHAMCGSLKVEEITFVSISQTKL
jgi:hypothetical protein